MPTLESRATVGLRPPRSRSRIPASDPDVAGHYNGPAMNMAGKPHSHCQARWRGVQKYHMDENGWSDVAYTACVCHHEIVMQGRGPGIRTAANGTNAGNNGWYAIFFMVGGDEEPSAAMLRAADWYARTHLKTNDWVPHSFFKSTGCPGKVKNYIRNGRLIVPSGGTAPQPSGKLGDRILSLEDPMLEGEDVREWQTLLNRWRSGIAGDVDGVFGPTTASATSTFMREAMSIVTDDPHVGAKTIAAMHDALKPAPTPEPSAHLARRLSMIIVHAHRGTVDAETASALVSASGAQAVVSTSTELAKEVLGTISGAPEDATLIIVGGPAMKPVLDREAETGVAWHRGGKVATVIGQTAMDTARLLTEVAANGWSR